MEEVKTSPDIPALTVFAEAGTSNGRYLLRFKRGAFENLNTIQPFFIEYYSPFTNPSCDVFPMHLHVMFMACQFFSTIKLRRMPIIGFSEELKRKAKGNNVEVYAETVRDIYSQIFGIKKVDNSLMDKVRLNKYLYGSGTLDDNKTE